MKSFLFANVPLGVGHFMPLKGLLGLPRLRIGFLVDPAALTKSYERA